MKKLFNCLSKRINIFAELIHDKAVILIAIIQFVVKSTLYISAGIATVMIMLAKDNDKMEILQIFVTKSETLIPLMTGVSLLLFLVLVLPFFVNPIKTKVGRVFSFLFILLFLVGIVVKAFI